MALVTAERLHRWKCKFCGSKDKNIVTFNFPKTKPNVFGKTSLDNYAEGVKIVCCNQCGMTEIFSHSAMLFASAISNSTHKLSLEESEEFVAKQHELNHLDPKVNPHAVDGPDKDLYENT